MLQEIFEALNFSSLWLYFIAMIKTKFYIFYNYHKLITVFATQVNTQLVLTGYHEAAYIDRFLN